MSISQPAETQDGESAFGSDSSSVLDWKPSEPPAPTTRKALSAINVQVREKIMRGVIKEGSFIFVRKVRKTGLLGLLLKFKLQSDFWKKICNYLETLPDFVTLRLFLTF